MILALAMSLAAANLKASGKARELANAAKFNAVEIFKDSKATSKVGTGIIIGSNNVNIYVLTAAHVIYETTQQRHPLDSTLLIEHQVAQKRYARFTLQPDTIAELIDLGAFRLNSKEDIAIVSAVIPAGLKDYKRDILGNDAVVEIGNQAALLHGNGSVVCPEARFSDVRKGEVLLLEQSTCFTEAGMSGASVFHWSGLVGIHNGKLTGDVPYSTRMTSVRSLLRENENIPFDLTEYVQSQSNKNDINREICTPFKDVLKSQDRFGLLCLSISDCADNDNVPGLEEIEALFDSSKTAFPRVMRCELVEVEQLDQRELPGCMIYVEVKYRLRNTGEARNLIFHMTGSQDAETGEWKIAAIEN